MTDLEWKEEYSDLTRRLAVLDTVEMPRSLSSRELFEKMDRMAEEGQKEEPGAPVRGRVFYWRPVMSYAAAFLLLVAVYYGAGLGSDSVSMAPAENGMPMAVAQDAASSAAAASAPASSSMAAEPHDEPVPRQALSAEAPETQETATEQPTPDVLKEETADLAPQENGETEYDQAVSHTVLSVPALGGEISQCAENAAQAFEEAEAVVWGRVSEVEISRYAEDASAHSLPWGRVTLSDAVCIKGEIPDESLTFFHAGGYVAATDYYEQTTRPSANQETMKEGLEGKYVQVLLGSSQINPEPGKEYLVMLSQDEDGQWRAAPGKWDILEIREGVITGPEGETYGTPQSPRWEK